MIAAELVANVTVTGAEQAAAQLGMVGDSVTRSAVGAAVAGGMMERYGGQIVGAFTGAAGAAMAYETDMQNVASITDLNTAQIAAMGQQVLVLGEATAQGPDVLAKGLYDVISAGFSASDAMTIVGVSAVAASAGLTTEDTAGRAITATLNAYGMQVSDATHVSDVFFQSVKDGVYTFGNLSDSIGVNLAMGAKMGVSLEELNAGYVVMTRQGMSLDESVTSTTQLMNSFMKPSKDMVGVIQSLGYEDGATMVQQLGLAGSVEAVTHAVGGNNAEIAKLFPNIRAARGEAALAKNDFRDWKDEINVMNKAWQDGTATQEAYDKQQQATSFHTGQLREALNRLKITLGTEFLPMVSLGADGLRILVDGFLNLPPAFGMIASFAGVATGGFISLVGAMTMFRALNMGPVIAEVAGTLAGFAAPLAVAAVGAGLLYLAWQTNFLGIQDTVRRVAGDVGDAFDTWREKTNQLETYGFNPLAANLFGLGSGLEAILGPGNAVSDWLQTAAVDVQAFGTSYEVARDKGLNPFAAALDAIAVQGDRLLGDNQLSRWATKMSADAQEMGKHWQDAGALAALSGHMIGITVQSVALGLENLAGKGTTLGNVFHTIADIADQWGVRFGALLTQGLNPVAAGFEALGGAIQRISGNNALAQWAIRLGVDFTVLGAFWDKFVADLSSGDFQAALGDIGGALSTLGDIAGATFDLLVAGFQAIDWGAVASTIFDGLGAAVSAAAGAVDWGAAFSGLLAGLTAAAQAAVSGGIALGRVLVNVAEWARGAWPDIWTWLMGIVDTAGAQAVNLANIAVNVAGWARGAWPDIWTWLRSILDTAGAQAVNLASIAVNVAGWARGVWPDIWTWLKGIVDTAGVQAVNLATIAVNVAGWARGAWPDIWTWLKGIVDTAGAQAVNLASVIVNVVGWVPGAIQDVWAWLKGLVDVTGAQSVDLTVPLNVVWKAAGAAGSIIADAYKWVNDQLGGGQFSAGDLSNAEALGRTIGENVSRLVIAGVTAGFGAGGGGGSSSMFGTGGGSGGLDAAVGAFVTGLWDGVKTALMSALGAKNGDDFNKIVGEKVTAALKGIPGAIASAFGSINFSGGLVGALADSGSPEGGGSFRGSPGAGDLNIALENAIEAKLGLGPGGFFETINTRMEGKLAAASASVTALGHTMWSTIQSSLTTALAGGGAALGGGENVVTGLGNDGLLIANAISTRLGAMLDSAVTAIGAGGGRIASGVATLVGAIRTTVTGMWQQVQAAITGALGGDGGGTPSLAGGIITAPGSSGAGNPIGDMISRKLGAMLDGAIAAVSGGAGAIAGKVAGVVAAIRTTVTGMWQQIQAAISGALGGDGGGTPSLAGGIITAPGSSGAGNPIGDMISRSIGAMLDGAISAITGGDLAGKVAGVVDAIRTTISGLWTSIQGVVTDALSGGGNEGGGSFRGGTSGGDFGSIITDKLVTPIIDGIAAAATALSGVSWDGVVSAIQTGMDIISTGIAAAMVPVDAAVTAAMTVITRLQDLKSQITGLGGDGGLGAGTGAGGGGAGFGGGDMNLGSGSMGAHEPGSGGHDWLSGVPPVYGPPAPPPDKSPGGGAPSDITRGGSPVGLGGAGLGGGFGGGAAGIILGDGGTAKSSAGIPGMGTGGAMEKLPAPDISAWTALPGKIQGIMAQVAAAVGTGLQAALAGANAFGQGISRVFVTPLQQLGPLATTAMRGVAVGIGTGLQAALTAATSFGRAINTVLLTPLRQLGPQATAAMRAVAVGIGAGLQAALTAATSFGRAIYTVVSTQLGLLVGNVTAMMTALGNAIRTGFAAAQAAATAAAQAIYTSVSTSFGQLVGNVTALMAGLNANVSSAMSTMSSNMTSAAQSAASGMTDAMSSMASEAVGIVDGMAADIVGAVQGLAGEMQAAGAAAGQGLIDGLNSKLAGVQAAASALAAAAASAANTTLITASPSKVFHQIGAWTGQGFIEGLMSTHPKIADALAHMFHIGTGGGGGGTGVTGVINGAITASQRIYYGLGVLTGQSYTDGLKSMIAPATTAGTAIGNAVTAGIGSVSGSGGSLAHGLVTGIIQAHWDQATKSVKFYSAGGSSGAPHPGTGGGSGAGAGTGTTGDTNVNIQIHMQGSIVGRDGAEEWIRRNVAGEVLGALQQAMPAIAGGVSTQVYRRRDVGGFRHK